MSHTLAQDFPILWLQPGQAALIQQRRRDEEAALIIPLAGGVSTREWRCALARAWVASFLRPGGGADASHPLMEPKVVADFLNMTGERHRWGELALSHVHRLNVAAMLAANLLIHRPLRRRQ